MNLLAPEHRIFEPVARQNTGNEYGCAARTGYGTANGGGYGAGTGFYGMGNGSGYGRYDGSGWNNFHNEPIPIGIL